MTTRRKETVEEWLSALEGMGQQVVRHRNYAMPYHLLPHALQRLSLIHI